MSIPDWKVPQDLGLVIASIVLFFVSRYTIKREWDDKVERSSQDMYRTRVLKELDKLKGLESKIKELEQTIVSISDKVNVLAEAVDEYRDVKRRV